MRKAFLQTLLHIAKHDRRIFLLTGDLGYSVLEPFAEDFPDRYLNVGVAEQNMAGIAAGLAKEGFVPFIYSIGNFSTLRCMEQIRYDICYHNLNVKVVAVGGGFSYGAAGASHHCTEDFGMLRVIPNIAVCSPADPEEARQLTALIAQHDSPCYLRLGKGGEKSQHTSDFKLAWGKAIQVRSGQETAVFATGPILEHVKQELESSVSARSALYSFPFVKPLDQELLLKAAQQYSRIITIEEHQRSGGFGSALLESYNDMLERGALKQIPKIERRAIPDLFFREGGSQNYLRQKSGLRLFGATEG